MKQATAGESPSRWPWIDVLRGLTILWITAFHFYVDTRGGAGHLSSEAFVASLRAGDWLGAIDIGARTIIALPSYRLDVLLVVTGLVLMWARPVKAIPFWRRRARAVLPNYWLGTLAAALVLVGLALLRSLVHGTDPRFEIATGTLLARAPYTFEWVDVIRSMTVVGRLESTRAMQVVSPSLWYVLLILQFYLCFPLLRWLLTRVGAGWFLAICTATMCGARGLATAGWVWPGFDVPATLLYLLPCRLFGPALGMVGARYLPRMSVRPSRVIAVILCLPALGAVLWSVWIGAGENRVSLLGAAWPLLLGLPALWVLASSALHLRRTAAVLSWLGAHSLSLLVVQDLLRLVTGTAISLWGRLDPLTWYLLPGYLAAAVALTPLWHRLPAAVADRPTVTPTPVAVA